MKTVVQQSIIDGLYQHRLRVKQKESKRYLKLLFNDHFVVFLTFAFGALILLFRQLDGQEMMILGIKTSIWQLVVIPWLLLGLLFGHLQTNLLPADRVFLIAAEKTMQDNYLKKSLISSLIVSVSIQIFFWLLGLPLLIKAGLKSPWLIMLILFFLIGIKVLQIYREFNHVCPVNPAGQRSINWTRAINQAEKMAARRYRFFSLFAEVPGQKTTIKRRAYLDGLLRYFSFAKKPFQQLIFRQIIRSQLGLTLVFRQFLLVAFLLIMMRKQSILALSLLVVAFVYLANRQLWPIFEKNRRQLWNVLLFSGTAARMRAFIQVVFIVLMVLLAPLGALTIFLVSLKAGVMICCAGFLTMLAIHYQIYLKSVKIKGDN